MASIGEVYGKNFKEKAMNDKALHACNILVKNIVNNQLSFRCNSKEMWDNNNMKPNMIKTLCKQVSRNANLEMIHVLKTSKNINAFPYLIKGPVEYFILIDTSKVNTGQTNVYSLYITPDEMFVY
jgi:hypothetical protein